MSTVYDRETGEALGETQPEITDLEKLLRSTMAEFWKQNNLGQKYDVIRDALATAYKMGAGHAD